MPIAPTYPGVYIEEVPSGVRAINVRKASLLYINSPVIFVKELEG